MRKNKPVAILVLGPPRSGTSAVSNVISELGVEFGDPANFLDTEVYKHNPIFFELESLNNLNNDIIAEFNAEYVDGFLPEKSDFNENMLSKYKPIIKGLIDNEFKGASIIGMKDPRFCFTLPVWEYALKNLGFEIKIVYVCREVSAVIASNMSINKWSAMRNASIWLQSVLSARYFLSDCNYITIKYEEIIKEPFKEIAVLAERLGLFGANVEKASKVINIDYKNFDSSRRNELKYVNSIYKQIQSNRLDPDEYLHFREISLSAQSNSDHKIIQLQERLQQEQEKSDNLENEMSLLAQSKDLYIEAQARQLIAKNEHIEMLLGKGGKRGLQSLGGLLGSWKTRLRLGRTHLFDKDYYLTNNPDVRNIAMAPFMHYISYGAFEGRNPHSLFNSLYYLEHNPDVKQAGLNPLEHFVVSGGAEGRNPHPLFDSLYYLEHNPDIKQAGINPLEHYIVYGAEEGRNPSEHFDSISYYEMHPEIMELGVNPLVHSMSDEKAAKGMSENYHSNFLPGWEEGEQENSDLAVVYLSRYGDKDHEQLLRDFIISYQNHASGVGHDLVIIFKNYTHYKDLIKAKSYLEGISFIGLRMPDEHYDIGAYAFAAKVLNHKFILFLNSYSQVDGDGWLAKMYKHIQSPDVGIVAATASFESLYNSLKLLLKVSRVVKPDARLHYHYYYFLPAVFGHNVSFKAATEPEKITFMGVLKKALLEDSWKQKSMVIIRQLYIAARHFKTLCRLSIWWLSHFRHVMLLWARFPAYPNPHIRSTGFMMNRELFLEQVVNQEFNEKMDASYFESGRKSMTNKLLKKGYKLLVVGRDGEAYEMDEWPTSGTFRQGGQKNLLISDNRTRESMGGGEGNIALLSKITWGDYLPNNSVDVPTKGIEFNRGKPVG